MEWYPSLFLKFFRQLIFSCRHMCSLETLGTIPTSRLVFVENVFTSLYIVYPSQSLRDTSIAQESRGRLVHYSGDCATFTADLRSIYGRFAHCSWTKDNRVLNASGFASME